MDGVNISLSKFSLGDFINLEPLRQVFDIVLKLSIILVAIWLLIRIISFIKSGRVNRRMFRTYDNTEEIKKKLDNIERKLDKVLSKKKGKK
jgi:hypothetical protein